MGELERTEQEMRRRDSPRGRVEAFYKRHKGVWLLLAAMIAISAFWTDQWAWVAFFVGVALYAAWKRAYLGVLVGVSFALWFAARESDWHQYSETWDRVLGLCCIASLLLLVARGIEEPRGHA